MPVYSIELKYINKNLDGSVAVGYTQLVDDVDVLSGEVIYGSLADLNEEIANLHRRMIDSNVGHLILAARAKAINTDFNNINPLLNKKLTIDPNSVQVVRFQ